MLNKNPLSKYLKQGSEKYNAIINCHNKDVELFEISFLWFYNLRNVDSHLCEDVKMLNRLLKNFHSYLVRESQV